LSGDGGAQTPLIKKNTIRTRGGVTGHNVRYVLAFGGSSSLSLLSAHILAVCRFRRASPATSLDPPGCRPNKIRELMARGMTEKNEPSARKGWCFYPRVQAGTENNSISIEPSRVRCVGPLSTRRSSRRLHVVI